MADGCRTSTVIVVGTLVLGLLAVDVVYSQRMVSGFKPIVTVFCPGAPAAAASINATDHLGRAHAFQLPDERHQTERHGASKEGDRHGASKATSGSRDDSTRLDGVGTGAKGSAGDPLLVPMIFLATDLSPFVVVCLEAARQYNPGSALYVVTSNHSVRPDEAMMSLLKLPNVRVKVIEHYMGPGTDAAKFAERYIHQSMTAIPFERFCFQRYFIIRDVAREEGIPRFLHMDTDVSLFADIRQFSQFETDLVALTMHSSWWTIWKLKALEDFCDYQLDFYDRPRSELEEDWERHGQHVPRDNGTYFLQWSDMFMIGSFLTKRAAEISVHYLVYDGTQFVDGYLQYWAMVNLQNFAGWDCELEDVLTHIKWRKEASSGQILPYAVTKKDGTKIVTLDEEIELRGIHWQGFLCKQVAPVILGEVLKGQVPDEGKLLAKRAKRADGR